MKRSGTERRKWNITGILLLAVVMLTGGTLAYFYDDDAVRTMFTSGDYDSIKVRIIEPAWKSDTQGLDSVPGDNIPADPTIVNVDDPVYMRVKITLTDRQTKHIITGSRAEKIMSMIRYAASTEEVNAVKSAMTEAEMEQKLPKQINTGEYTYDEARSSFGDGMFYYNYTAGSGSNRGVLGTEEQAILYNYVIVPFDWTERDIAEIGEFIVNIEGQAIHTENYDFDTEARIQSPERAFELIHELVK